MNHSPAADRGLRYWIRAWLPVLVCVAAICAETTTNFGSDHTSRPLRWLWENIFGPVSWREWEQIHHYLRKTGHFLGYGLIGLAWLHAWCLTFSRWRFFHCSWMAVLCTACVAAADEFHQAFLPNRTGTLRDVILDTCGAVALQLLAWLWMRVFRRESLQLRGQGSS